MRLSGIILAVAAIAAFAFGVYYYYGRDLIAAQTSLAEISDTDWQRGANLMSELEEKTSPSAMMLAARMGNRRAQTLAGDALTNGGYGYPFDPAKGASFLASAADAGDIRAQVMLAIFLTRRALDREPDLDGARNLFRAAAAQEGALSHYAAAVLALGLDPENYDAAAGEAHLREARRLQVPGALVLIARTAWPSGPWASNEARFQALQEAVDAGSASANSMMGRVLLLGGFGQDPDPTRALPFVERANHAGNAEARYTLGTMYYQAEAGLTQDKERARELWELAAQQGESRAQYLMATILMEADEDPLAVRWMQVAAENGDSQALLEIGRWHFNGQMGFAENEAESANWFKRAADAGNADAATLVGIDYASEGGQLPVDEALATRYLRFAADRGQALAMYSLARIYLRDGPHKNIREGVRMMRASADAGNEGANVMMGAMYMSGTNVQLNDRTALGYFRRAPDAPMSQAGMGLFYYYGEAGLQRDRARGIALMQTAARSGEEFAQRKLREWGETW